MKAKKIILLSGAVSLVVVMFSAAFADDLAKGMVLYQAYCQQCHGDKGDGKGPEAPALDPKPVDFTATSTSVLTYALIEKAIIDGVASVPTHQWGNKLENDEIVKIIQYTSNFQKQ